MLGSPIADKAMAELARRDLRGWLDWLAGRELAPQTRRHCLKLVRCVLGEAVDDEILDRNPAAGLRVRGGAVRPWTYLHPHEQQAILWAFDVPEADQLRIAFAIGTGLRQGEQWNLELRDVHVDAAVPHVVVRYGGPRHETPKNGRPRRVDLFGVGLDAAERWLELLRDRPNRYGLMWPTPRGARRQRSKNYGLAWQLRMSGIWRPIRWHDLRHTCATSLVNGWWGRRWTLPEVRDYLGHRSIGVTERYAHLAADALDVAAQGTHGGPLLRVQRGGRERADDPPPPRRSGVGLRSQRSRVRIAPGALVQLGELATLAGSFLAAAGRSDGSARELGETFVRQLTRALDEARAVVAVDHGDEHAVERAHELADAVVEICAAIGR